MADGTVRAICSKERKVVLMPLLYAAKLEMQHQKVKKGEKWTRVCHVEGFPTWSEALKFEWAWKFYSRKLDQKLFPLDRRRQALDNLLALERPTSKAMAYDEWETPIKVVWENDELIKEK